MDPRVPCARRSDMEHLHPQLPIVMAVMSTWRREAAFPHIAVSGVGAAAGRSTHQTWCAEHGLSNGCVHYGP